MLYVLTSLADSSGNEILPQTTSKANADDTFDNTDTDIKKNLVLKLFLVLWYF